MNIFIRSIKLYFLGLIVEAHKRCFDSLVDKYIEKNRPLSGRALTILSHRCSHLYIKFNNEERLLLNDILERRISH